MHALITGGAGSIGSRLAAALIERGDSVTVVDVRADPVAPSAAFEQRGRAGGGDAGCGVHR